MTDPVCQVCGHRPDQHADDGCTAIPFGARCGCTHLTAHIIPDIAALDADVIAAAEAWTDSHPSERVGPVYRNIESAVRARREALTPPVSEWFGRVSDNGGGQFTVIVRRDTMEYPSVGTYVRIERIDGPT